MDVALNIRNCQRKRMIEGTVAFCIAALGIRSRKTLHIHTIPDLFATRGCQGGVCEHDGNIVMLLDSKLSYRNLLIVICHEMIHVKQASTGKLKMIDGIDYWCGRPWSGDYENQPWEIDAFTNMYPLAGAVIRGQLGIA